jgi:predicted transcriptional regulator
MTLTIELPEAVERKLAEKASRSGRTPAAYVTELIERAVAPEKTLDEILGPIRQEFAESGMTEEEFDVLIEEAREVPRGEDDCRSTICHLCWARG